MASFGGPPTSNNRPATERLLASTAGGLVPPGWAICVVDTAPIVCRSIRPATEPYDAFAGTAGPLASPSARLAALWRALPTSEVLGTHLVLVAQLSRPAQTALLARVDGREANREATPVEPGRYGITYFDLGALTPGQYLVAVIDQVPIPPPTRVAILTQVVGLLVCPSGLGNASPGCTSP